MIQFKSLKKWSKKNLIRVTSRFNLIGTIYYLKNNKNIILLYLLLLY